jgi:anthranilate synthase component 2
MKILVLDNYDSFTYNLVHMLKDLGYGPYLEVYRNDVLSLDAVAQFDKILLSPGPGVPKNAGLMPEIVKQYGPSKSILGVCLGHQAIAEVYGAQLYNLSEVLHGVQRRIQILDPKEPLFHNIPSYYQICHYHSWAVKRDSLNAPLLLTAQGENGEVMAIRHQHYDVKGVQFHPESIASNYGHQLLKNWIEQAPE